ncbi:prepilin-type N-terminal cleavage/methylation domain-containing protein [Tepidimonas thermarum]|uniref:prepilin-type N-terminal cleavage/methylation domain-containing protein n=1 Tax=Tepidimonas thermarum TaxID=335431 RepID=UPI00163D63B5
MATTPTALAHRGLTLIEALVVILILAILGLIAYPLLKDIIVQQRGHVITQQLLSTLTGR